MHVCKRDLTRSPPVPFLFASVWSKEVFALQHLTAKHAAYTVNNHSPDRKPFAKVNNPRSNLLASKASDECERTVWRNTHFPTIAPNIEAAHPAVVVIPT